MGDTKPWNNRLHKTKYTRSSILSYRVGLDPVTTSYLIRLIEKTYNIPGLHLSNYKTYLKKEPLNETLAWNPQTMLQTRNLIRNQLIPSALVSLHILIHRLHLFLQLTANSRIIHFIIKMIKLSPASIHHWRYYQAWYGPDDIYK